MIHSNYQKALNDFIEKVEKDKHILLVILVGSMAYGQLWDKSDIDVVLIVDEFKEPIKENSFLEEDIVINASIFNRIKFKRLLESESSRGPFHSFLSVGKIVYFRDESLKKYVEKELLSNGCEDGVLLFNGAISVAHLIKTMKWIKVEEDFEYAMYELSRMVEALARMILVLNNRTPMREPLREARDINDLTKNLYELFVERKSSATIMDLIQSIQCFLTENRAQIFSGVYKLFVDATMPMTITELHEQIGIQIKIDKPLLVELMEWLCTQDDFMRTTVATRVTSKSRMTLDEIAYVIERDV